MITIVLPIFNGTVWRAPDAGAPLRGWRDLAALLGGVTLAGLLVLTQQTAVLWIAGLLSSLGVLVMFTIIGAVLFLSFTRREGIARRWRDLALPATVGLAFALALIGGIDAVRYALTGTWEGFDMGG